MTLSQVFPTKKLQQRTTQAVSLSRNSADRPNEPALTTGPTARTAPLVFVSIMLAAFMVAIESTIVATAIPRIAGQLGGFANCS